MLFARIGGVSVRALLSFIFITGVAQAQSNPQQLKAIQQQLDLVKREAVSKLPPELQKALSSGAHNLLVAAFSSVFLAYF